MFLTSAALCGYFDKLMSFQHIGISDRPEAFENRPGVQCGGLREKADSAVYLCRGIK
jgi:hypothetical protein